MLIRFFMIMVFFMVMPFVLMLMGPLFFLHALYGFLAVDLDHIHQPQGFRRLFSHGFQDLFHPDIILSAHADEQVTVLDIPDILGRRLIGMDLLTGLEQHTDVRLPAGDLSDKIILGKNGGDHLQAAALFLPRRRRAAACQQNQDQYKGPPRFSALFRFL